MHGPNCRHQRTVNKHAVIALQTIFGIGSTRARNICAAVDVPTDKKIRELDEAQIDALCGSWQVLGRG